MNMLDLPILKEGISSLSRKIFDRIYEEYYSIGTLTIPEGMTEWAIKQFGSIDVLEKQRLLRLRNKWTGHEVVFNSIRANRPQPKNEPVTEEQILQEAQKPPFNDVYNLTPESFFGRVEGKHCVTASNVSMYDSWHGVLVFKQPNPLDISEEKLIDLFEVSNKWFGLVHEKDPEAKYPMFQWNCLWRAGASIAWGHTQVTLSKGTPLSAVRTRKEINDRYLKEFGVGYFDDLFILHKELGLGFDAGNMRVILPMDATKEREFMILSDTFGNDEARLLYQILAQYKTLYDVNSFNIAGYLHPIGKRAYGLPVILRGIDRGALHAKNSEYGIMEVLAEVDVVTIDPFASVEAVRTACDRFRNG